MRHSAFLVKATVPTCPGHLFKQVAPVPSLEGTVAPQPYADRLNAALERAGMSVRSLAGELAERFGGSVETNRRWVYKIKAGTEPEARRAAALAEIFGDPQLANVRPTAERRRDRLGELEERVGRVEQRQEIAFPEVLSRLADLEEGLERLEQRRARRRRVE